MKRLWILAAFALLALAGHGWTSGFLCLNHGIHCICPPAQDCPNCCPCTGHHHTSAAQAARAARYIAQLQCGCCCDRIEAARKLGHHCNGDVCCDPQVEDALIHALLCDTCWEVRRAAGFSLLLQEDRKPEAVMALFVSSKLDHHYLVREQSTETLDVVLVCRRNCYCDLFGDMGKTLIASLKTSGFRPGTDNCILVLDECAAHCGMLENTSPAVSVSIKAAEAPVLHSPGK